MGLQINLGLQQQLIVLIVSLPLGLHPSSLGPSSFSTRGLCPSPLGPSSFSTWAFSLYLASFRILINMCIHIWRYLWVYICIIEKDFPYRFVKRKCFKNYLRKMFLTKLLFFSVFWWWCFFYLNFGWKNLIKIKRQMYFISNSLLFKFQEYYLYLVTLYCLALFCQSIFYLKLCNLIV